MVIYLLRHGDAGKREAWAGPDRDRPLSSEGMKQSRQTAAALADLKPGIALVISSPYLRARQTAEIFAGVLEPRVEHRTDDRLAPGFGKDGLAELIRENGASGALMLVGHEPDFSRIIAACIGGGRVELKAGGLARLELEETPTLKGTLVWLFPPKVLAR